MDNFGLTDKEREMNLHNYNHALFKNMMFFMDIAWEINILTGTVVFLQDKNEPEKSSTEFIYEDVFYDYMENRIKEEEQVIFEKFMSPENIRKLKQETSLDIWIRIKEEEWTLHRVVLTPAYDKSGNLYCVYFGARNLQEEVSRDMMEYHGYEQFQKALIANCYFHFEFDLTGEALIQEDFVTNDGVHLIKELTGMELPVPMDLFIRKWHEKYEPHFEKRSDDNVFSIEYLQNAYAKNVRLINTEVKQKVAVGDNMPEFLQEFIILMKDPMNKRIHASVIWRDIGSLHRRTIRDNRELQMSNKELKKTVNQEEQFRRAVLSGSLLVYNINLTRNLLEEEVYEVVDGKQYPILELMGLTAPCSFDEFCTRWCSTYVMESSKETFLKMYNRKYMLDAYEKGERYLEIEFDTTLARNITITLRNVALLVEDKKSGDIIAMINSKDISKQRKEELRQREMLREASDAANRANAAKTEFLTRMSHDIRTPMNAIIGMTAIAGKHLDNAERITDCLNKITVSSKYLLTLLDELLDLNRIESGEMNFQENEIDILEMIDNIHIIYGSQVKEKGHYLTVEKNDIIHEKAIGDSRRINQILMNLMDNAIKYTPDDGRINLTVTEKTVERPGMGCYEIILEDNGIGMSKDFLNHLFEPFVRAKDRYVEKVQGTGLGLTIAKSIVQMMGGTIEVESEPGKGSKFTVTIFLKLPDHAAAKEESTEVKAAEKEKEENNSALDRLVEKNFSGHRALLVEDNDINAEIAEEILNMVGIDVDHAWNGKEAVNMVAAKEDGYYDIIFMDLSMPVMDGYEAARAIRALRIRDAQTIPIYAMSANAYEQDIQASLNAGMNGHIVKPLNFQYLETVLCANLSK